MLRGRVEASGGRTTSLINALTIDLEEYFHVGRPGEGPRVEDLRAMPSRIESDAHRVLDLLAETGVRATFFVLGEVARTHPGVVASIASAGHEIACHGFRHRPVDGLTAETLSEDLDDAIESIGAAAGVRPSGYRAPIWSLSWATWALDVLVAKRFSYDSSLVPVAPLGPPDLTPHAIRLSAAGGTIVEIPPLTGRAGPWRFPLGFGLGLRLLPTAWLVRAIEAENAAGRPAAVAFHPWELDPSPPAMRLAPHLAVAHGFATEKLRGKLGALLDRVRFGTAAEALEGLDLRLAAISGRRAA